MPDMAAIQASMTANTTGDIKAHHFQEAFHSVSPFELIMGRANLDNMRSGSMIGFDDMNKGSGGQMRATGFKLSPTPGSHLAIWDPADASGAHQWGPLRCEIQLDAYYRVAGGPSPHLYVSRAGGSTKIMHGGVADQVGSRYVHHVVTYDTLLPGDGLFLHLGPWGTPAGATYMDMMLGVKLLGWLAMRPYDIDIPENP